MVSQKRILSDIKPIKSVGNFPNLTAGIFLGKIPKSEEKQTISYQKLYSQQLMYTFIVWIVSQSIRQGDRQPLHFASTQVAFPLSYSFWREESFLQELN